MFVLLLVLALLVVPVNSIREDPATFLSYATDNGIKLFAPLEDVRCGRLVAAGETGSYTCEDFRGPEGLEGITLFSLNTPFIHAIELNFDSSTVSVEDLVEEVETFFPEFEPLLKETSVTLYVSSAGEGLSYLAITHGHRSDLGVADLFLVLMTEETRRIFK